VNTDILLLGMEKKKEGGWGKDKKKKQKEGVERGDLEHAQPKIGGEGSTIHPGCFEGKAISSL